MTDRPIIMTAEAKPSPPGSGPPTRVFEEGDLERVAEAFNRLPIAATARVGTHQDGRTRWIAVHRDSDGACILTRALRTRVHDLPKVGDRAPQSWTVELEVLAMQGQCAARMRK